MTSRQKKTAIALVKKHGYQTASSRTGVSVGSLVRWKKEIDPGAVKERETLQRLGCVIELRMEQEKMTVAGLSESTGLARSTLRTIIAGESDVQYSSLCLLARHLRFKNVVELLQEI